MHVVLKSDCRGRGAFHVKTFVVQLQYTVHKVYLSVRFNVSDLFSGEKPFGACTPANTLAAGQEQRVHSSSSNHSQYSGAFDKYCRRQSTWPYATHVLVPNTYTPMEVTGNSQCAGFVISCVL